MKNIVFDNSFNSLIKNIKRAICTIKLKKAKLISGYSDLAVVAIIKNEGNYIEEWVKYHLFVGVDTIFLYDNDSTDNTDEILKKYIDSGKVQMISWPGRGRQLDAYNDALMKHRQDCKYIAFIDADEFLFSCEPSKNVKQQVEDIFNNNPHAGGIAVNWRVFGSSGYIKKPSGGVLENYLYRGKENAKGNDCIKSIVNPRKVYKFEHVHFPVYILGSYAVSENGERVNGWQHFAKSINRIRINHYFTKSKEEWIQRRSIGKADSKDINNKRTMDEFFSHDNNDIYDDGMLYYVRLMDNSKL